MLSKVITLDKFGQPSYQDIYFKFIVHLFKVYFKSLINFQNIAET